MANWEDCMTSTTPQDMLHCSLYKMYEVLKQSDEYTLWKFHFLSSLGLMKGRVEKFLANLHSLTSRSGGWREENHCPCVPWSGQAPDERTHTGKRLHKGRFIYDIIRLWDLWHSFVVMMWYCHHRLPYPLLLPNPLYFFLTLSVTPSLSSFTIFFSDHWLFVNATSFMIRP